MQRQTVTKKKERQSEKIKIHQLQKHKMHSQCISKRNRVLRPFHATNHENSEVNNVNKRTEWMKNNQGSI